MTNEMIWACAEEGQGKDFKDGAARQKAKATEKIHGCTMSLLAYGR